MSLLSEKKVEDAWYLSRLDVFWIVGDVLR